MLVLFKIKFLILLFYYLGKLDRKYSSAQFFFESSTLNSKDWQNEFKNKFNGFWKTRIEFLKNDKDETIAKDNELKDMIAFVKKLRDLIKQLDIDAKKCIHILKNFYESNQVILKNKVTEKDWKRFMKLNNQLDKILINEVRKKQLDETSSCCFAGHQDVLFKYPKLFFHLNGHHFEEIIFSMFFISSDIEFKAGTLIDEVVQEKGAMNECGYLVPNDLREIFKRIDRFKMPVPTKNSDENC